MLLSNTIYFHEGHRWGRPVPQLVLNSEETCQMAECIR